MNTNEVDDIRRQMAMIRREIHTDVSGVVDNVGEAFDWRAPIRNHPYVALGAGLLAGYLLVPRKKSRGRRVPAAVAAPAPIVAPRPTAAPVEPPKPRGRRLLGWAAGMVWPLVNQSLQSYAAMWLEDLLKKQMDVDRKPPAAVDPRPSSERPGGFHDDATVRIARWG